MVGLESAYTKLSKAVEVIYNDNYVNFYANLENNAKNSNYYLMQRECQKYSSLRSSRFRWLEAS